MNLPHFEEVPNSVCAPEGFRAAGVAAGIKTAGPDVALIVSDHPASAAAVFTTNRVQAAPIHVCREHLRASEGRARAVVVNAGNANACTGAQGLADARRMAALAGEAVGVPAEQVLVASTGIIGHRLPMEKIEAGIRGASASLERSADSTAAAIMTTDLVPKSAAVQFEIGGRLVRVGGICKGSGMIGPHLATMLAFLTTDADVWPEVLQPALAAVAARTFNCTTVDGDTSTNAGHPGKRPFGRTGAAGLARGTGVRGGAGAGLHGTGPSSGARWRGRYKADRDPCARGADCGRCPTDRDDNCELPAGEDGVLRE
jgi:glutamate N-acetyltransferase / amino-acid N-acetyltransferase